jgi:hypothetical protein
VYHRHSVKGSFIFTSGYGSGATPFGVPIRPHYMLEAANAFCSVHVARCQTSAWFFQVLAVIAMMLSGSGYGLFVTHPKLLVRIPAASLAHWFDKLALMCGRTVVLNFCTLNGQITTGENDFSGPFVRRPSIARDPIRYRG